jgi:hypothetical protein
MTDQELHAEAKRQQEIQKRNRPDSQLWMAASRIIHHVAAEIARRNRAKGEKPA